MNISGKCRIYKNQINGKDLYSTSISQKNINGDWEKMFLSVQLPKDVALEDKSDINITKGFLSFYKNKNGIALPKIVVQEFQDKEGIEEREAIQNEQNYNINDDDLPF